MPNNGHRHTPPIWPSGTQDERHIQDTLYIPKVTIADGVWLKRVLPALQRRAHAQPGAVTVEDIALRYRRGRLGIADALDAASELLAPLAAAGAALEHRSAWMIGDDNDEDDDNDDDDDDDEERPARLSEEPDQDLLLSMRVMVDAAADDAGAAVLHWVFLALTD